MIVSIPSIANDIEITQISAHNCHQPVIEPRIESTELHYSICSSHVESEGTVTWSRVMNPTKPTSFRNKIQITRTEMEQYFYCPQRLAAQKLGVSVSTLKRRFYNLGIGRWPYQLTQDKRKRSVWHLVNEEEPKSEKELSPNTVQTLTRLFSMSLQEQHLLATRYSSSQRSVSLNGDGSPNFKFLHYVPKGEAIEQSQSQGSSISSSSPIAEKPGIRKRQRRFLQLDDGSVKGGANRKRQKISWRQ